MPANRAIFYETISAAVNDMADHGYDSAERLAYWEVKIRQAAEASLVPEWELVETLNRTLHTTYRHQIEGGAILRNHRGIPRFTIDKVRPELRAELNRRIMVSAQLINLNRQAAIERTIQRFSGWGSSIPIGGSDAVPLRATKKEIRKSMAQLPFEERRVAIDQGHKFLGALNDILATDGDAIAMTWHSRHAPGYNNRKTHLERDGLTYAIKSSWAVEEGLINKGAGYTVDMTAPGEEVFCFPGDSAIPYADGVKVAYRRWYCGEMVSLSTASGKTLRSTPNHPILTTHGWIAAGLLQEGDEVIEAGEEGFAKAKDHHNHIVPSIAEVFSTCMEVGIAKVRRGRHDDFHGDGTQHDIDVVNAHRPLSFGVKASRLKGFNDLPLTLSNAFSTALRSLKSFRHCCLGALPLLASILRQALAVLSRGAFHPQLASLYGASGIETGGGQVLHDHSPGDAKFLRQRQYACALSEETHDFRRVIQANAGTAMDDLLVKTSLFEAPKNLIRTSTEGCTDLLNGLPFTTKATKISRVQRDPWAGHVYNLQTRDGWYVADGVIVHNCSCHGEYLYHLSDLPPAMLTAKGRTQLAAVRIRA